MKFIIGVLLIFAYAHATETSFDSSRDFSEVTITDALTDDASKFVQKLLGILTEKSIMDESTGNRLMATFGMQGTSQADAFTSTTITSVSIAGDSDARKRFINNVAASINKSEKSGRNLVKYLLELILDNTLMDINDAAQLAADNGYSVSIQVTRYITTTTYDSTVTIKNTPAINDVHTLNNALLEHLIKFEIIDFKTASDILKTFDIKGTGTLANAAGTPLTADTILKMIINKDAAARAKFIKWITSQLGQTKNSSFLMTNLFQLLIDNGVIDVDGATKLAADHNCDLAVDRKEASTGDQAQQGTVTTTRPATSPAPSDECPCDD